MYKRQGYVLKLKYRLLVLAGYVLKLKYMFLDLVIALFFDAFCVLIELRGFLPFLRSDFLFRITQFLIAGYLGFLTS